MLRMISSEGALTIRAMESALEDFLLISRWLSDPQVLEFYEGRDRPFSLAAAQEHFDPQQMEEEEVVPCILEFAGQPVGYLQFYPVDEEGRLEYQFEQPGSVFALDLFIGEPEYWNRGIGTDFIRLLLRYLFHQRGADWVILDPHVDNYRAVRAYEKCGFRKIKLLPKHEWHEGSYVDSWLMGVEKSRYMDVS